ncbi:hypothetical protein C2E23DRAFT_412252 [Lenzites betulinus]|nr:hypothetical protein C2E23DRAFT_412252 [Lenzites betulinus]
MVDDVLSCRCLEAEERSRADRVVGVHHRTLPRRRFIFPASPRHPRECCKASRVRAHPEGVVRVRRRSRRESRCGDGRACGILRKRGQESIMSTALSRGRALGTAANGADRVMPGASNGTRWANRAPWPGDRLRRVQEQLSFEPQGSAVAREIDWTHKVGDMYESGPGNEWGCSTASLPAHAVSGTFQDRSRTEQTSRLPVPASLACRRGQFP